VFQNSKVQVLNNQRRQKLRLALMAASSQQQQQYNKCRVADCFFKH
jgi:hypothetical protein